jgi:phosphoribosylformimino-5-aminoimidazole carboxamide ribotide isomerase
LAEAVSIPVIASGGVSSLKDIENLMAIEASGVTGVITGKAVYTGAIKLAEAVALTKGTN